MGIIYCYTNTVTGKKYIGQTLYPNRRKACHKHNAKKGLKFYFYKSIRKYGFDKFEYTVLEETDNLSERETYYIKKFNTLWPNGYNQQLEAHMATEEMRKKISESQKKRLANLSEEERKAWNEKKSKSLTGRKQPESQKKKVAEKLSAIWQVTHPDGKIEKVTNLNKWCKDNGLGTTGQSNLNRGSYKGYKAFRLS